MVVVLLESLARMETSYCEHLFFLNQFITYLLGRYLKYSDYSFVTEIKIIVSKLFKTVFVFEVAYNSISTINVYLINESRDFTIIIPNNTACPMSNFMVLLAGNVRR